MIANHTDTIVACATPHGVAGIAVIRCSGEQALSIALNLVKKKHYNLNKLKFVLFMIHQPNAALMLGVLFILKDQSLLLAKIVSSFIVILVHILLKPFLAYVSN